MDTKKIINFLKKLNANNTREWFNDNRKEYDEVKKYHADLINEFIKHIAKFDNSVVGLTAKECIFRINRDIRFSNDKTPYKTNFGAYIIEGGRKNWKCGYYVHLENNNSLIAGGLHIPQSDWLLKARMAISDRGDELMTLINKPNYKKIFGHFGGDKLKSAPRDFDINDKYIELIKLKSFDIFYNYKNEIVYDVDNFINDAITKFKILKPVNDFFNEALK
ncbi:MAG: DUF2461 domain-containing protein [Bacteroidetes bacterium]|nr:DUF2461 domain-containing protein [Bacteroidota bacterium]